MLMQIVKGVAKGDLLAVVAHLLLRSGRINVLQRFSLTRVRTVEETRVGSAGQTPSPAHRELSGSSG